MKNIQLKWKIFFFLLGFCGLLLVILWLFQTVFLSDMYKTIRKGEMEKAILYVEKNIEQQSLEEISAVLMEEKEILLTETADFRPEMKFRPEPKEDRKMKPREETLTEVRSFTLSDGSSLSLTFHAMITPVDATVATLKIQLYIITFAMIVLSVLLALLIARKVARPIEDINESAKVLAAGNYDTHFEGEGYLEIAELAGTLNTASKELSKVENLRRELMANISHDLRTPLSLIYSYAEMMHDFPGEITSDQTQVIMDEAKRLSGLVDDVFEISKLETGNQTLNLTLFDLTGSIRAAIGRMEELVKKDGYSFCFTAEEDVFVNGDEVKLAQVFYNLLINAIHYSGKERDIVVRQTLLKDCVRIEVIDKGEGISPENLPYIWDRYYKADKSHKRAVAGTGLGLSIVKKMVVLHGGTYGVESEEGKGSCFWFVLPRAVH